MIPEQMTPFSMATPSSLNKRSLKVSIPKLLLARPCTIIAADCTPTLPPIAAINGVKNANSILFAISKIPITWAPIIPPIKPISSHGSLALVRVTILSDESTCSEIPEALL